MSSTHLNSRLAQLLLVFSLVIGVGIAMSTTVQAQYGRYGYDIYQIAHDQGYRDGVDHGAEHAREGHRYDPEGTRHYKDATSGYRSSYGSKDAYKSAYRDGFRQGYDEGFRRSGGAYGRARGTDDPYYRNDDPYYRNDPDYRNDRNRDYGRYGNDVYRIAQDQGYRDGVDHGAEHAREGKRYDPESTRHYKDATSGYRSEYGNKDAYKQAYREGFRQGYDEGYRRYGGRYGRRNSRPSDILGNILRWP